MMISSALRRVRQLTKFCNNSRQLLQKTQTAENANSIALQLSFSSSADACAATAKVLGTITTPVTKKLWMDRIARQGLSALANLQPAAPRPRHPELHSIAYSLSTDTELRETYRSPWNYVRIGKLLEDLDSMAGNVSFAHTDDGDARTLPPLLVTANVERIRLARHIPIDGGDLLLTGRVVWTGSTSMDILVQVYQGKGPAATAGVSPALSAMFTFVARDPLTNKPMKINPLLPETPEDIQIFAERQASKLNEARKALRASGSSEALSFPDAESAGRGSVPAAAVARWTEESLLEAKTLLELPALADQGAIVMSQTAAQNHFVCQPQHKNLHGRVFGGYLMRRAFELAFASCYAFAGARPQFVGMDDITFSRPVEIGSLLKLSSLICHAGKGNVHVEVVASVTKPESVSSVVSSKYMFTFALPEGHRVKRVLPSTHGEARKAARFNLDAILAQPQVANVAK